MRYLSEIKTNELVRANCNRKRALPCRDLLLCRDSWVRFRAVPVDLGDHCVPSPAPGSLFQFRSNPDVFESRMEKRSEVKKQPVGHSKQGEFIRCMEEKRTAIMPDSLCFLLQTLDSILNVEMVKEKSAEEITQIWNQYFSAKDTVYAVIPVSSSAVVLQAPRSATQGETAPSQLVLYHYPDLQKEKGIVLMTAEMDSKFLVVQDAQCLANQVQLFYATDRSDTYGLVETFNHRSSDFKYMAVIAELEQSGLGRELRPGQASDKS
uniref:ATP synthase mitochondrial F1 complex assembly factor 1 n=1 Tax=Zonotrichia albicollis TaxID=44394 RepID=A0A8D2LZU8_ZONAL